MEILRERYTEDKNEPFDDLSTKNKLKVVMKDNKKYFVKVINKNYQVLFMNDRNSQKSIPRELFFLQLLNDSNLCPKLIEFYEEEQEVSVIMEYLTDNWKDLHSFVDVQRDESIVKQIIKNVVISLYELSKKNVYHLDIKPENIMVNVDNLSVKMIDFEDAVFNISCNAMSDSYVGTLGYRSPETYSGFYNIKQNQVFSVGCLVFSCLELEPPFDSETSVIRNKRKVSFNCSDLAMDLVNKCLEMDPKDRIPFHDLLNHQWFSQ